MTREQELEKEVEKDKKIGMKSPEDWITAISNQAELKGIKEEQQRVLKEVKHIQNQLVKESASWQIIEKIIKEIKEK